eukprot:GHVU01048970.1.p1 GENE.GHVU01048970.1~~GHVU01048970.1.p1  ORF type:complete len:170 (+),score=13.03 GHVU01048970.1:503-1012(+)
MTRMYRQVSTTSGLADLISFMFDPGRQIAVIVVTNRRKCGAPVVALSALQSLCGGGAQVFHVNHCMLGPFNEALHNVFGIMPSGVRIYRAGMKLSDHHQRHPIWNEARCDRMLDEGVFADEVLCQINEVRRYVGGKDTLRRAPERPAAPTRPIDVPKRTRPILRISLSA